jgi:hypothetical protein
MGVLCAGELSGLFDVGMAITGGGTFWSKTCFRREHTSRPKVQIRIEGHRGAVYGAESPARGSWARPRCPRLGPGLPVAGGCEVSRGEWAGTGSRLLRFGELSITVLFVAHLPDRQNRERAV